MAKKMNSPEPTRKVPMNLPPPGHHQKEIVTIDWDQANPLRAGGSCSAGITVACTLTGPVNATQAATLVGNTDWTVDFGTVPPGTYVLTATGSDTSTFTVSIPVVRRQ